MSERIAFRRDGASEAQIADHLLRCDASFVPPLSGRADVYAYARKIASNATRFEAWDRALVGLLAAYCNDEKRVAAYITSVSVVDGWRGRGIASRLLEQCIEHARVREFQRVELEVDGENVSAIRLYTQNGFVIAAADGRTSTMRLDLGKGTK